MNFNTEKFVTVPVARVMAAFPDFEHNPDFRQIKEEQSMGLLTDKEFEDQVMEAAYMNYGRENVYAAVCVPEHISQPTFNFVNRTKSMAISVTCDTEEEAWSVINEEYRPLYRLEFIQNPS